MASLRRRDRSGTRLPLLRLPALGGKPIVAGRSYRWIARLDWAPDSGTASIDAARSARPHRPLVDLIRVGVVPRQVCGETAASSDDTACAASFRMASSLGWIGKAGSVGITPSIHLVPTGWHTSWPMLES